MFFTVSYKGSISLRGVKHHVRATEDSFSSGDVVPGDEEIRVCGE